MIKKLGIISTIFEEIRTGNDLSKLSNGYYFSAIEASCLLAKNEYAPQLLEISEIWCVKEKL